MTGRYGASVSKYCFVLPTKRSCTFLRQYFSDAIANMFGQADDAPDMPHITTISELTDTLSGASKGTRLELLFSLYEAWRSLKGDDTDFERFKTWGETIMSDYNEVDLYCVEASELFQNLSRHNEIRTDYLTPEQRDIISRYFGITHPENEVKRFWEHFNKGKDKKVAQERFLSLWEMLYPLYAKYNELLEKRNKTYPGRAYRLACERIEEYGRRLLPYNKVVIAGFNALSRVERKLFKLISNLRSPDGGSLAEFFWDAPGLPLKKGAKIDAGHFLHTNATDFPCSLQGMDRYTEHLSFPEHIYVTACPGNTAQAKVISGIVNRILNSGGDKYIDPARIAIVLPDEGLLFPVFHSLPAQTVPSVNLTMGYPLRMTLAASFVTLVRQMQLRCRTVSSVTHFFAKDVKGLLGHTLTRLLLGVRNVETILGYILDRGLFFVSMNDILDAVAGQKDNEVLCERVKMLWQPLAEGSRVGDTCDYLERLLSIMLELLGNTPTDSGSSNEDKHARLDVTHLTKYLEGVREFRQVTASYKIDMDRRLVLNLIDRMLSAQTVSLQGEPTKGLQVMGMLETRALDFDYVIIPSMNERIFPRKLQKPTFIPNALRYGFGIATTRFQENIFAYYFYRLIARAKEVHLLYDASQGGMRSGDPSRFLLQLRYLYGKECPLVWNSARFNVATNRSETMSVSKNSILAARLGEYLLPGSGRALSASSLKDYLACPMKFYLAHIEGKRVEKEPEEFLDAVTQGNILHETMQELYDSLLPSGQSSGRRFVSKDIISSWLDGSRNIGTYGSYKEIVCRKINQYYLHRDNDAPLTGDAGIMADVLSKYVQWSLEADLRLAPFVYLGSEQKFDVAYPLDGDRLVNMTMIIDRMDEVCPPEGNTDKLRLRISDYKTGKDETSFSKVSDLTSGKKGKAIFQLMLYAALYPYCSKSVAHTTPVALSIYKTRSLKLNGFDTMVENGAKPVWDNQPYKAEFETGLREKLTELFDPDIPFSQCEDTNHCRYCDFAQLCNR